MTLEEVAKFAQSILGDGLVVVVGSGLSCAEGLPGMAELARHLCTASASLVGVAADSWRPVGAALAAGQGLESALGGAGGAPEALRQWIAREVRELIAPRERSVIAEVVSGARVLRLTRLLSDAMKPAHGTKVPIVTSNYDRLVELACERAGLHVDTMAVGLYGGYFRPEVSCLASCCRVLSRGRVASLEHVPRAPVLKPHGSLDWYESGGSVTRCSVDLPADPALIAPGAAKYEEGYRVPFDKHREFANNYIDRCARLLVVGYGFNDDDLQVHLGARIRGGTPALIITREATKAALDLAATAPRCLCLDRPAAGGGARASMGGAQCVVGTTELWDLGILTLEVLQ